MNEKMRITLLLTVICALCGPLAAVAGGFQPNILLSEDKLQYTQGGPKAATLSLPTHTATPPPEQAKTRTATVAQATQQTTQQTTVAQPTHTVTPSPKQAKVKKAAVAQPTQQATPPPAKSGASPASAARSAPSFNCAKASNAVERAICANPFLAEMDVSMAADYKKALKAVADRMALRAEQRQWLRHMHRQCANADLQCIQQHYGTRSAQLRAYD